MSAQSDIATLTRWASLSTTILYGETLSNNVAVGANMQVLVRLDYLQQSAYTKVEKQTNLLNVGWVPQHSLGRCDPARLLHRANQIVVAISLDDE